MWPPPAFARASILSLASAAVLASASPQKSLFSSVATLPPGVAPLRATTRPAAQPAGESPASAAPAVRSAKATSLQVAAVSAQPAASAPAPPPAATPARTSPARPARSVLRSNPYTGVMPPWVPPPPAARSGLDAWLGDLRYWGSVAYDFRAEDIQDQTGTRQHLVTTTIGTRGYLVRPWLADFSVGLGLTRSALDDGAAAGQDSFYTGSARLNLLPRSRFPFELHYDASDSRLESGLGSSIAYTSKLYGFSQRFRSATSGLQFAARYDHSEQDASDVGITTQDSRRLEASQAFEDHRLSLNLASDTNRRLATGDQTDRDGLVARHSYTPGSHLSVDTLLNYSRVDDRIAGNPGGLEFMQLASIGYWRDPQRPLTLTGSARLFLLQPSGANSTETRQVSALFGSTYAASRNLRLRASASTTETARDGRSIDASSLTAGFDYRSDTRELGPGTYDWFGSAAATLNNGATTGDALIATGLLGHSLGRVFPAGGRGRLAAVVTQTAAAQSGRPTDDPLAQTNQLTHAGSLSYSRFDGGGSTLLRVTLSDSRFLNGRRDVLQLANLQAARTVEAGRNGSWSGNVTVQAARQRSDDPLRSRVATDRFATVVSADVTYQRLNLFDVRLLRFFSQLRVNRDDTVVFLGSPIERETASWENRLDYSIGRTDLRLTARVAEVDGRARNLFVFKFVRRFGN